MRMHDVKPTNGRDDSGKSKLPRLGPLPDEPPGNGALQRTGTSDRRQVGGAMPTADANRVFGVGAPLALLVVGVMNWR